MRNYLIKTVITGLLISLLFTSISAQNFLFQNMPKNKSQLGFRFMKPHYEDNRELSLLSAAYDLWLNIPVSAKINFVGSLPFMNYAEKEGDNASGIGDIYVGFQTKPVSESGNKSSVSIGIFFPSASDEFYSTFIGYYTNYYEFEKYFSDRLTIYGNYSYYKIQSRGVIFGAEIGPNIFIPTKGEGKTELYAHYGILGGFKLTNVIFSAELAGRATISKDTGNYADRYVHAIAFGAQAMRSCLRPGIFYEIYLNEGFRDFVDGVLGMKVDIDLK